MLNAVTVLLDIRLILRWCCNSIIFLNIRMCLMLSMDMNEFNVWFDLWLSCNLLIRIWFTLIFSSWFFLVSAMKRIPSKALYISGHRWPGLPHPLPELSCLASMWTLSDELPWILQLPFREKCPPWSPYPPFVLQTLGSEIWTCLQSKLKLINLLLILFLLWIISVVAGAVVTKGWLWSGW